MKIKTLFLFFVAIVLLSITASAHPGSWDENGGHYNRSTGEYHFHHGQPEHQHPNNTCEYNFKNPSKASTDSSASSSAGSPPKYTASDIADITGMPVVELEPPQKKQHILVTIFAFLCLYTLIFLLPCMIGLFIVVTIIDKIFKTKISDCFNYKPLWFFSFIFFMPFILSKMFDFKYEKHLVVIDIVLFIGMIIYYRIKDNEFYEAEENTKNTIPPPALPIVYTENQKLLSIISDKLEALRTKLDILQSHLSNISEISIIDELKSGKINKQKATELLRERSNLRAEIDKIIEEFNSTVDIHNELLTEIERENTAVAQEPPATVVTAAPPMQYEGKPVRARHCKHCGGLLPQDSGKCFDCGKNNFRFIPPKLTTSSVLAVVLAIGLTLVCIVSYHQSVKIAELSEVIAKNNEIIEENQSTILKLNADILSGESRQKALSERLSDARASTSNYVKSAAKYLEKATFLDYNIAFVPVDGKKYHKYHTYDCTYITAYSFWVDNIYDAENMGYTPCALCH